MQRDSVTEFMESLAGTTRRKKYTVNFVEGSCAPRAVEGEDVQARVDQLMRDEKMDLTAATHKAMCEARDRKETAFAEAEGKRRKEWMKGHDNVQAYVAFNETVNASLDPTGFGTQARVEELMAKGMTHEAALRQARAEESAPLNPDAVSKFKEFLANLIRDHASREGYQPQLDPDVHRAATELVRTLNESVLRGMGNARQIATLLGK